jgi:predicted PurR-regulated permease PerM
MDKKGLIFTLDSFLALIPILIVMVALTNIISSEITPFSHQINSIQNAQDILEIMSTPNKSGNNILQNMANTLSRNGNSQTGIKEAGEIADYYLNNTLGKSKYSLMETNQLNKTISSRGDIKTAHEISVSFKSCKNYIFKLYIWN